MIKHIICIECPNGCSLEVEIENNKVSIRCQQAEIVLKLANQIEIPD